MEFFVGVDWRLELFPCFLNKRVNRIQAVLLFNLFLLEKLRTVYERGLLFDEVKVEVYFF
jgi:hypothetical protein